MSYEWPQEPEPLSRTVSQMLTQGIPEADALAVRDTTTKMWADEPGGWVHEWSTVAPPAMPARTTHAWLHRPTGGRISRPWRERSQTGCPPPTARRSTSWPLRFSAWSSSGTCSTSLHVGTTLGSRSTCSANTTLPADAPVMLISGGVDSWKMDLHGLLVTLAVLTGMRVMAFDIAGTGDSAVPMTAAGGAEIVRGLAAGRVTRQRGRGPYRGLYGRLLLGAVRSRQRTWTRPSLLGGPVEKAFSQGAAGFGMDGIVGNAFGFDHQPTLEELVTARRDFSTCPARLLDQDTNAPMLVINGAEDVHVPQQDTLVFDGRRDCTAAAHAGHRALLRA